MRGCPLGVTPGPRRPNQSTSALAPKADQLSARSEGPRRAIFGSKGSLHQRPRFALLVTGPAGDDVRIFVSPLVGLTGGAQLRRYLPRTPGSILGGNDGRIACATRRLNV